MQITGRFAWRPHRRWLRPTITGVHQTPDSAAAIKLQVRIRMQLGGRLYARTGNTLPSGFQCGLLGTAVSFCRNRKSLSDHGLGVIPEGVCPVFGALAWDAAKSHADPSNPGTSEKSAIAAGL